MKQIFIFFLVVFVASACSQKEKYEVKGLIENGAGTVLYFQKMESNDAVIIDSVKLSSKGEFSFKGDRLSEPTFFLLKFTDKNYITLLADSTECIEVFAKANNLEESYELKNSIGSAGIQILNRRMAKLNKELDGLIDDYEKLENKDGDAGRQLEIEYNQVIKDHKAYIGEFVMENPRSFAGYYALFQRLRDGSMIMNVMDKNDQVYFATIATSLNLFYPESDRAKQMYNFVLGAKAQQQSQQLQEKLLATANSTGYPDLEVGDVNGEMHKLSELQGKVILLSFWASWDEASRNENKNLKKVYSKYHKQGFEVYQVSLDRSKILWENAIQQDELPWINVSDLRYTDSYPAKLYNIRQLPANFLISAKGEIIGKDLFGSRLSEKIGELF